MLIHIVESGERVDVALFADTGSERPQTYRYLPIFKQWLEDRGVPLIVVKYQPKNYKNFPPYRTLEENCLTNGTLLSKTFGYGSCSQKWKIQPQDQWANSWEPARRCWAGLLSKYGEMQTKSGDAVKQSALFFLRKNTQAPVGHDGREALTHVATTDGLKGEDVQDLMIIAAKCHSASRQRVLRPK